MSQRNLVDWLQVAGNIGLIAGLILVAVQIRDSNRIASAEMFSASVDTTVSLNTSQLGEAPQASMSRVLYEAQDATVEDFYVADRIYDALFRILVRVHVFDDLGLYGGGGITPQGFVQVHYQAFGCPYGLSWLDQTLEKFRKGGGSDQPLFKSLELMRDLARTNNAQSDMADRQKRALEILSRLMKD